MMKALQVYYHDHFPVPLPKDHRFPMPKYALLRQKVMQSDLASQVELCPGPAASDRELTLAHDPVYVRRVQNGELSQKEMRRIGFPWSLGLVERSRRSVGSTIAACRAAVTCGLGVNLAGGTHHAGRDQGQGFCVFNDSAVAARVMQQERSAARIVILDCDVHQGNGTADIFAEDPSVFTFSIHGAKNFPFRKSASDLDIALEDGADDADYLDALKWGLEQALKLARADMAIYLAGADPYENDRLGRLAVTKQGLGERDRLILTACRSAGLSIAVTMSGGYARIIEDTVDIHFQTVQIAAEFTAESSTDLSASG